MAARRSSRPIRSISTLLDFHYRRHYTAERGQHGKGANKQGKSGADTILRVPSAPWCPTETGRSRSATSQTQGSGSWSRGALAAAAAMRDFVSSTNRAPRRADLGRAGEERWMHLELKLLADVGVVGFPNAGKSTLVSRLSAATPKIADYPFTTLVPALGIVRVDEHSTFVIADLPGLIAGAAQGKGLGHRFLRHTERTRLLVHLVDLDPTNGREPVQDWQTIQDELAAYSDDLAARPQIVAANKASCPARRSDGAPSKISALPADCPSTRSPR